MQLFAHFGPVRTVELGSKLSRELKKICPALVGTTKGYWEIKLPPDDPRVQRITQCLRKHGWNPKLPFYEFHKNDVSLDFSIDREYSEQDFDQATYLEPRPRAAIIHFSRSEQGSPFIELNEFHPMRPRSEIPEIAGISSWRVCLTERLMTKMQNYSLRGVRFAPLDCRDERLQGNDIEYVKVDWPKFPGPYWELASDHRMPRVSQTNTLIHADGAPFTGDYTRGCLNREKHFGPCELHYDASSLKNLGDHDIFETAEFFFYGGGAPHEWNRKLIVSQRFRQFCLAENLPMGWIPVRIDPD